jgi:uncharacterized protein
VLAGLDLGWLPQAQGKQVGILLLVVVPLQLTASIVALLSRSTAPAGASAIVAVGWAGEGLIHVVEAPGATSKALGLALIAVGALAVPSSAVTAMTRPLPALVFGVTGVRFVLSGIYELSATGAWKHAASIVGLVVVGLAALALLETELRAQAAGDSG